jgi:sugar O-acyltransferase (sialic acid O-acetyltransferase NeuD family)
MNNGHELNADLEPPVVVIGGSGHGKVLASTLLMQHHRVLGFVDVNPDLPPLLGIPHLGDDGAVLLHPPGRVRLVNGVGSIASTTLRQNVYERFKELQYIFECVIHPSAIVAAEVEREEGVQIMAGAVVQPGSQLGANVIINTGARVDHDCAIDAHAHIAPGVTLSGNVHVGRGAHIGSGATIVQGIKVGPGAIVGAGAVVLCDVPAGVTVVGIPAAPMAKPRAFRR